MKYEKLGNIVIILKGKKVVPADKFDERSMRYLQIDDLRNDDQIKYTNDNDGVLATEEDILLAWDGANAGTVGYGKRGYIGSTIALLRKRELAKYNTVFLGKLLQRKFDYLRRSATGATIPHIDRKSLENINVPILDLSDQIRIAKILTKADALIAQRRESIKLLEELLKSTFLEMFYTNKNTKDWNEVRFEELAEKKKASMRSGPFGSSLLHGEFKESGDVKVLGIDNVVTNRFTWKKSRCITFEKFQELKRYKVYPNDVLISIMATLGRTAVVPRNIPLCINSKHLAAITLDKEIANPYFIAYAFHSLPSIVKQLSNSVKGAIMDGLNLNIIKGIKLKHPPIDLQNKFGEIFEKTEVLKNQYISSLQELENLYGALGQKAFKGELDLSGLIISEEEYFNLEQQESRRLEREWDEREESEEFIKLRAELQEKYYSLPMNHASEEEILSVITKMQKELASGKKIPFWPPFLRWDLKNKFNNRSLTFDNIWSEVNQNIYQQKPTYDYLKSIVFDWLYEEFLIQRFNDKTKTLELLIYETT